MADGQPELRKPATYADLRAAPAHLIAELVDGELWTQPRPAPKHTNAASMLGVRLGGPFHAGDNGPGGWWILDEPELHLDGIVLVPDLAGWRRERMPALPETAYFETAPDWVCEVISPGTSKRDRGRKSDLYAEQGVGWIWLIDPDARTLEAFQNQDGRWLRLGAWADEAAPRVAPFDAIALGLGALWA